MHNEALGHLNRGLTFGHQGKLIEAASCFRKSLKANPAYPEALYALGVSLRELALKSGDLKGLSDAISCFRNALKFKPNYFEALYNLGVELGRSQATLNEAITCYRRAIIIAPGFLDAYNNLGHALLATGETKEAVSYFRRVVKANPRHPAAHSNLLYALTHNADFSAKECLSAARQYGEVFSKRGVVNPMAWRYEPLPNRLRVGVVSGDLRDHPVGRFLEGFLKNVNPLILELFAYPTLPQTDKLTTRIKPCFAAWRSLVGVGDEAASQMIREDGVHVLLDLAGHTANNRLPMFAGRAAPVQASWLGYFATTGVATMDYLIADPWTLPPSEEQYFTEKIWRLPETRLCFTPPEIDVPVAQLPALAKKHITFGCFSSIAKLNDNVIALWSQLLHAIPDSRLFLKARQLADAAVRKKLLERFAVTGVGADRLLLEGPSPRADYLAAYGQVDIGLDTFPFTGGTTTAESLWMGVPVLTLAGDCFLARQGIGLLMNAGLTDWVANNPIEYVAKAVEKSRDLSGLASLRSALRHQVATSPLFDASRFARQFEQAMWDMWAVHSGKKSPE